MTTRERLEHKLEKREEWAEKAHERCSAEFNTASEIIKDIPPGQPIMTGHHSEAGHRRLLDRSASHMDKGCEQYKLAEYHESKARGLQEKLEKTIFSDDEDAVERIEAKIEQKQKLQEAFKTVNKGIKKGTLTIVEAIRLLTDAGERNAAWYVDPKYGVPSYHMTNNNSEIRRLKQRLVTIQNRNARREAAEQSENGITITRNVNIAYIDITFAEKPDRTIINALKTSSFYWRQGSWHGREADLPAPVKALISDTTTANA